MADLIATVRKAIAKPFETPVEAANCQHNDVQQERYIGEDMFVARKGAPAWRTGNWRA